MRNARGLVRFESVRQADTGVQSNGLPDSGNPVLRDALLAKETCSGISAVDLEPLIATAVVGDAEVMKDATEEDKFVVVIDATVQALGGGKFSSEEVTANAVVGEELGGDVERQLQRC